MNVNLLSLLLFLTDAGTNVGAQRTMRSFAMCFTNSWNVHWFGSDASNRLIRGRSEKHVLNCFIANIHGDYSLLLAHLFRY